MTFRMAAEWEPHERSLMAWPTDGTGWGRHLGEARGTYVGLANAIAAFEPVTMVVRLEGAGSLNSRH
jgi:agmatine deiminase